jgi:hypothetical protein
VQRDIDLMRKLLMNIELRGATSPIDALHSGAAADSDERVRYHLRLLIDAGLLKEAGQNSAGAPCVRLTHEGLEFVELSRSDVRWSHAKAIVREATGGVPFTVLKTLLAKKAWRSVAQNQRRRAIRGRRKVHRYVEHVEPEVWLDSCAPDPEALWDDDQVRLVRQKTPVHRHQRIPVGWESDLYNDLAAELADRPAESPLPDHLI